MHVLRIAIVVMALGLSSFGKAAVISSGTYNSIGGISAGGTEAYLPAIGGGTWVLDQQGEDLTYILNGSKSYLIRLAGKLWVLETEEDIRFEVGAGRPVISSGDITIQSCVLVGLGDFCKNSNIGPVSFDSIALMSVFPLGIETMSFFPIRDEFLAIKNRYFFNEISEVPLPAAGWLFTGAIGGLLVARRRN